MNFRSNNNQKAWKTRTYLTNRPMQPNSDGQKMMALQIDESFLMPYSDEKRPEGPAQIGVAGKTFYMEPMADCMKVTRLK